MVYRVVENRSTRVIAFRLPKDRAEQLERIAAEVGKPVGRMVADMVERRIDEVLATTKGGDR